VPYALENSKETQRLEDQSRLGGYDVGRELAELIVSPGSTVLDAGCGTGIASRYLATAFPESHVLGFDTSEDRLNDARFGARGIPNVRFEAGDATKLAYSAGSFDVVVCRYVLEHMSTRTARAAVAELHRCLKPGGVAVFIDVDGLFHNLYPLPASVRKGLAAIRRYRALDLRVGRKIPSYCARAGFDRVDWRIDSMQFRGEALDAELAMVERRFEQAKPLLATLLGGMTAAGEFAGDYVEAARSPGSVLFYDKFVVTARKAAPRLRLAP
jgi:SAM-dependent methyltransferase